MTLCSSQTHFITYCKASALQQPHSWDACFATCAAHGAKYCKKCSQQRSAGQAK